MQFRLLLIVMLLLSLSACSFDVQVLTPNPAASASVVDLQTATSMPPESTSEAISTIVPSFTPTFPVAALPTIDIPDRIKFEANGTYIDIVANMAGGASKTYVVNAQKGQIMSISILQSPQEQWTAIPIHVKGADGAILCPQVENTECLFWRGMLPSTQDYFVTLTPAGNAQNLTLRVAINPPSVANQFFKYDSSNNNLAISYSDEFAPALFPGALIYKIEPELTLQFINSQFYTGTNLIEAYLLLGATDDAALVSTCTRTASLGGPETIVSVVEVNGIQFTKSEATGAAAGNFYEQKYYRAVHNGICYEIMFFVHTGDIGAYAPGTTREFDRAALLRKFDSVLSTLVIQ